jgi:DNA repair protein RadD
MIELRPYQEEAVTEAMRILEDSPTFLLQAPTASGKTIIFIEMIRRYLTQYPDMKIGILAHRQELIIQAMEKLLNVWPEGVRQAGYACAGVGKVDVDSRIVIGSVQTLARRELSEPFDLLIIDECHRLGDANADSQYNRIIKANLDANPCFRMLGVTATPYRLNHGYIYGDKCRPDKQNIFPALNYQFPMGEAVRQGALVPWHGKQPVDILADLKKIRLEKGEYNPGELTDLLIRDRHMKSVPEAYENYGKGRKHCLVFAVTIEHAIALRDCFVARGYAADVLHSKMATGDRKATLRAFWAGRTQFLVNVAILTEGWDCPQVDLIMLCRPTKSPALFVQMIGRGMRPHPGKRDVLILDMSNNFREHGMPENPRVRYRKRIIDEGAPLKTCPCCKELIPLATMTCPVCGMVFTREKEDNKEINKAPQMEDINSGDNRDEYKRLKPYSFSVYRHKVKSAMNIGKEMLCVTIYFLGHQPPIKVFLDIEGVIGINAQLKARFVWNFLAKGAKFPKDIGEACERKRELKLPPVLNVNRSKKFKEILEFEWAMNKNDRHKGKAAT